MFLHTVWQQNLGDPLQEWEDENKCVQNLVGKFHVKNVRDKPRSEGE
jgi:hypothetical protein